MNVDYELTGIEATLRGADGGATLEALKEAGESLVDVAAAANGNAQLQARCAEAAMVLARRFAEESHLLAHAENATSTALSVARQSGDHSLLARAAWLRAQHLLTIGARKDALECLIAAIETIDASRVDAPLMGALWHAMGVGWLGLAPFEEDARESFERALENRAEATIARLESLVLRGAAEHLHSLGQRAEDTLGQAARLAESIGAPATLRAQVAWWRALGALQAGEQGSASGHLETLQALTKSSSEESVGLLAQSIEGLIQLYFVDVTSGIAAVVAVQQRINSVWPPMRFPLLALRAAADQKGLEAIQKAYAEHRDSEHKRDLGLQNFARGVTAALGDELMSLLETQGEVLAAKAEREAAQVLNVLMENTVITELREDSTGEHPYRVGALAAQLARRLGKDSAHCRTLEVAAALHDIGKTGLPDSLVLKRSRLEPHQREAMKEHAETGWRLLSEQRMEHPVLAMGAVIARHHHEHWDGNGYPDGLIGDGIPLEARICALAEVFDALTHKRPWRAARSVDNALKVIGSLRGYQFDPALTDAFVAMINELVQAHGSGLDVFLGRKAQKSALLATRKALLERSREGIEEEEEVE